MRTHQVARPETSAALEALQCELDEALAEGDLDRALILDRVVEEQKALDDESGRKEARHG